MPVLDWVNKTQAVREAATVPYHLLQFSQGYGEPNADNLLIQGDNLLALKALLPFYRGRVKCIYADPPFNTEQAFPDYDDKLEHSSRAYSSRQNYGLHWPQWSWQNNLTKTTRWPNNA